MIDMVQEDIGMVQFIASKLRGTFLSGIYQLSGYFFHILSLSCYISSFGYISVCVNGINTLIDEALFFPFNHFFVYLIKQTILEFRSEHACDEHSS